MTSTSGDGPAHDSAMVLLVDDQAIVGEAVRRLLAGEHDIDLHFCPNPAEAIELANRLQPTVILQDLVMPGIDGLELVRRFRDNAQTAETPIIVLSTKEDPRTKSESFKAGASDYLVKLPDRIELVARIRYHSAAALNTRRRNAIAAALRGSQRALGERVIELSSALEEIERLQRAKADFYSMVTHDLRNPASNMSSAMKMLLAENSDGLTPRQRQLVAIGARGSEKLLRLINDYLDFAKIDAGFLRLDLHDVDLSSLVQMACDETQPQAAVKQQQIEVAIPPGSPRIHADGPKLEQVFENLLSNAVKYTGDGGRIKVALSADDSHVVVRVSDSGAGISPEHLPNLFTKYHRVPGEATRNAKGTGLGLLIVKEIVEAHEGTIQAESSGVAGEGTTFTVRLPLAGPQSR